MKRYVFVMVIFAFILVACGGESKNEGGLEAVDGDGNTPRSSANQGKAALAENSDTTTADALVANDSALAKVVPSDTNIFEMPVVEDMAGQLLIVQGNTRRPGYDIGDEGRIFYASFEGGLPEMIATRVYTTSVILSPDKQKLAFIAVDGIRWYLNILDIKTREVTQLMRLQSQFGNVTGWSPDGAWVILNIPVPVGPGQILVKLDGSETVNLGNGTAFWTTDNRIVFMNWQIFQGTFQPPQAQDVQIYDLATGEWSPVDISLDITTLNIAGGMDLVSDLTAQSIELAPNFATFGQYGFGAMILPDGEQILMSQGTTPPDSLSNVPPHCSDWEIALYAPTGEQTHLLYEAENTAYVSDFRQVEDSFYYERWYFEGCQLDNVALRIAIERITPDAEVEVLTETVYPGEDINLAFMRVNNGTKYDISADGRYMVWLEGNYNDLLTGLRLTDLVTGETVDLMTWQSSNTNTFLTSEAFTSVFWIPEA